MPHRRERTRRAKLCLLAGLEELHRARQHLEVAGRVEVTAELSRLIVAIEELHAGLKKENHH